MKFVRIAILISVALLLAGCSKTNTNKTSSNATNASASPKATVAVSKSPSGTTVETKISTPEAAANGLLEAWKTKDETAAAKFATEAAYEKLFTEGGAPEGMSSQGCSDEEGTLNCAFTYDGGALLMYVKGSESTGYKVDSIEFIAD